jgi:hypothetical protein
LDSESDDEVVNDPILGRIKNKQLQHFKNESKRGKVLNKRLRRLAVFTYGDELSDDTDIMALVKIAGGQGGQGFDSHLIENVQDKVVAFNARFIKMKEYAMKYKKMMHQHFETDDKVKVGQWYDNWKKEFMMLPTDYVLLEDKSFLKWVTAYAKDANKFDKDFAKAFQKLEENGTKGLKATEWV